MSVAEQETQPDEPPQLTEKGDEAPATTATEKDAEEPGKEDAPVTEITEHAVEQTDEKPEEKTDAEREQPTESAQVTETEEQKNYANLQPLIVAMETSEDAESIHNQEITSTSTEAPAKQASTTDAETLQQNISQQLNTANQQTNIILQSVPVSGEQSAITLATLLQDMVSGMHSGTGNTPAAAVIPDPNNPNAYLLLSPGNVPLGEHMVVTSVPGVGLVSSNGTTFVVSHPEGEHTLETIAQAAGPTLANLSTQATSQAAEGESEEMTGDMLGHDSDAERDQSAGSSTTKSLPSSSAKAIGSKSRRLSDGPRTCEQCDKTFKYPSDLKKHLQIHTDVKKFRCDECNRYFRRQHQLIVHQRIHTGEKPFVCNRCGTAFRHDSTLTMHIRTRHEHLRPFKCDTCGNTFGRLSHLRKHARKVCCNKDKDGNAIFQCKFCDESFPTKIDMKKHMACCERKDSKLKNSPVTFHVCEVCKKEFASTYNLRRHQVTHSDEKPYQCHLCLKPFKEKASLNKHIKRVHKDDSGSQELDPSGMDGTTTVEEMALHAAAGHTATMTIETNQAEGLAPASVTMVTDATVDTTALLQLASDVVNSGNMHPLKDHISGVETVVTAAELVPTQTVARMEVDEEKTALCPTAVSSVVVTSEADLPSDEQQAAAEAEAAAMEVQQTESTAQVTDLDPEGKDAAAAAAAVFLSLADIATEGVTEQISHAIVQQQQ